QDSPSRFGTGECEGTLQNAVNYASNSGVDSTQGCEILRTEFAVDSAQTLGREQRAEAVLVQLQLCITSRGRVRPIALDRLVQEGTQFRMTQPPIAFVGDFVDLDAPHLAACVLTLGTDASEAENILWRQQGPLRRAHEDTS